MRQARVHEDPDELNNLAHEPQFAEVVKRFTDLGAEMWNAGELKAQIIADQNRRRLINEAHGIGRRPVWDYQPFVDASQQWVRAGKWTVEVEGKAHLDVIR